MPAREFFNKKSNETKDARKVRERRDQINAMNIHGTNLFFTAVENNKYAEVKKMIYEGAEVNVRTTSRGLISNIAVSVPYAVGATPLHAACLLGAPDIAQLLLTHGARANTKDNAGHTPLDYAILSYNYFKDDVARKETARFSFQRSVNKAETRLAEFDLVIATLLAHGGKPAMFVLPEPFGGTGTKPNMPPLP